jgi:phospholipid/cholesterol/gamma-HCH transport system substrate-binding protein
MIRRWVAVTLSALTVLLAGCGVSPTDLPLPGTRVDGDSYSLDLEFGSVLNLPARSKVIYNGSRIGVLRGVDVAERDGTRVAIATVDISSEVSLPAGTTAELTQATLLGDFFISLSAPPTGSAGTLAPGAVIPLARTTVAPQVEELLGGIAALANGGTVATLQRVISNANNAFPDDTADRDVGIEVLRALIARSASQSRSVTGIIDSVASVAATLDANRTRLGFAFEFGPRRVSGAVSAFLGLSNVLNALGPNVDPIGNLILPRYATLQGLIGIIDPLVATAVRLDAQAPADMEKLDRLINDRMVAWLADPAIDIVDVTRPDGRPSGQSGVDTRTVAAVLRMIGAMR